MCEVEEFSSALLFLYKALSSYVVTKERYLPAKH